MLGLFHATPVLRSCSASSCVIVIGHLPTTTPPSTSKPAKSLCHLCFRRLSPGSYFQGTDQLPVQPASHSNFSELPAPAGHSCPTWTMPFTTCQNGIPGSLLPGSILRSLVRRGHQLDVGADAIGGREMTEKISAAAINRDEL